MRLFKKFLEPLNSIRERPLQFICWGLVAIVLGLSGFWLPLLISIVTYSETSAVFQNLMIAGNLPIFSIVILAECVAALIVAMGTGSNIVAAGMRGIMSTIAMVVLVVQVCILQVHSGSKNITVSVAFEFGATILTILLASYLYCFRFSSWEKSVSSIKDDEEKEVSKLAREAQAKATDEEGIKL